MYFSPLAMRELVAGLGPRTAAAVSALLPGPVTLVVANPEHRYPFACREDRRAARRPPPRRAAGRRDVPGLPDLGQPQRRARSGSLRGRPRRDRRRRRPGDRRRRADRPALDRRRHRRDRGGRRLDDPPPRRPLRRATSPAPSPPSASASRRSAAGLPRKGRRTRRREVLSFSFDSKSRSWGSTVITKAKQPRRPATLIHCLS